MAKINYNVNTKNKIIDIHNRWGGGLKTVDTDDALGATYLRDAQNVSISEYNFLEKRFGLLEKSAMETTYDIQGYFEYVEENGDITKIHILGGNIYINGVNNTPTQNIDDLFFDSFVVPSYPYQTTRRVEGVRIANILYIFTGTYPVYYKGDGNIYLVPSKFPSYNELTDYSFNLLSQTYEEDMYRYNSDEEDTQESATLNLLEPLEGFEVLQNDLTPQVPSVELIGANLIGNYTDMLDNGYSRARVSQIMFELKMQYPGCVVNNLDNYDLTSKVIGVSYKLSSAPLSEYTPLTLYSKLSPANSYENEAGLCAYGSNVTQLSNLADGVELLDSYVRVFLKNLGSGLYDFKITTRFERYDGITFEDSVEYVEYVKAVDITVEALKADEDLPKGVHTCNRVIEHYGKIMVYGSTQNPEQLYISAYRDPTYFPAYHYMEFENELQEGITAVTPFMNILVVQTDTKTYGVKGNTALEPALFSVNQTDQFSRFNINLSVGCIAPNSVRPVRNRLYFLSRQGITSLKSLYATDDQYNVEYIDRNIENIIPMDVEAVAIQHDNQYWIDFPNSGFSLRYYIDKKAWVKDVYEIEDYKGVFKYIQENGALRIITHRSNGKIYEVLVDKSLPYDLGTPPLTVIIPAFLDQGMPFHPKNYKELKMNLTLQNEYNQEKGIIETTTTGSGALFYAFEASVLVGHKYTFEYDEVTHADNASVGLEVYANGVLLDTVVIPEYSTSIEYLIPYNTSSVLDFKLVSVEAYGLTTTIYNSLSIYDSTYNARVDFDVWATTEKSVLATPESTTIEIVNDETVEVYNKEANLVFDLGTNLGTWVFGISEFGDILTAVKTLKLSGKGYNFRFKIEDQTASKWTLESVGITFKMKKARSR